MCDGKADLISFDVGTQQIAETCAVKLKERHFVEDHVFLDAGHNVALHFLFGDDASVGQRRVVDGVADQRVLDVGKHDVVDLLLVLVCDAKCLLEGDDTIHFGNCAKQILGIFHVISLSCHKAERQAQKCCEKNALFHCMCV